MIRFTLAAAAALTVVAGVANAGAIPYPNPGTENPDTYTFTAMNTGDLVAYFAGSGASYDEQVGLLVNGVPQGGLGLDDHSTPVGASYDFGPVVAGDTLTFYDNVSTTGDVWYSDKSLNSDGAQHVYSTPAAAGQAYAGSPAGIYVAFEDLPASGSDFNYFDDTFVFTNTALVTGTPEPATWALMLAGFGLVGVAARRRAAMA